MSKIGQLEKAIASLKADRAVLDLAIAKLESQREPPGKPMPKPRLSAAEKVS